MKKTFTTDDLIENLLVATLGEEADMRQRHVLREALRGLVRCAKSEQTLEIKTSVRKLTGAMDSHAARRRAKAVLLAQRLPAILNQAQQQFEFKS